jgi:hypothetical protein
MLKQIKENKLHLRELVAFFEATANLGEGHKLNRYE